LPALYRGFTGALPGLYSHFAIALLCLIRYMAGLAVVVQRLSLLYSVPGCGCCCAVGLL